MDYSTFDYKTETKFGICITELLIEFMPALGINPTGNTKNDFDKVESFIKTKINRELTDKEKISMLKEIGNFVMSEPQTNEREKAIRYLINLNFIEDDNTQK